MAPLTFNQIIKAWQRGAITDSEKRDGLILCKRALTSAIRLRAYLQTEEAKANAKTIEHRVVTDRHRKNEPTDKGRDKAERENDELETDEPGSDEPGSDEPRNDEPGNDEPGNDEPGNHEPKEPLNP